MAREAYREQSEEIDRWIIVVGKLWDMAVMTIMHCRFEATSVSVRVRAFDEM